MLILFIKIIYSENKVFIFLIKFIMSNPNQSATTQNPPNQPNQIDKQNSEANEFSQLSAICGYAIASTFINIYRSDNALMNITIDGEVGGSNKVATDKKNRVNRMMKLLEIESKELNMIKNEMIGQGIFSQNSANKIGRINNSIFEVFLRLFKEEIDGAKLSKEQNCTIVNNSMYSGSYDQQKIYRQELLHRYINKYIIPAEVRNTYDVAFPIPPKIGIDVKTLDTVITTFLVVLWARVLENADGKFLHNSQILNVISMEEKILNNKYYNIQTNNSKDFDVVKAFEISNYFANIFKISIQETLAHHYSKCRVSFSSPLIEKQSKIVHGNNQ